MITISKVETNTTENTVSIWQYELDENTYNVVRSTLTMAVPVPAWADPMDVAGLLMIHAIKTDRWAYGRQ